jgi:hypothetical protein
MENINKETVRKRLKIGEIEAKVVDKYFISNFPNISNELKGDKDNTWSAMQLYILYLCYDGSGSISKAASKFSSLSNRSQTSASKRLKRLLIQVNNSLPIQTLEDEECNDDSVTSTEEESDVHVEDSENEILMPPSHSIGMPLQSPKVKFKTLLFLFTFQCHDVMFLNSKSANCAYIKTSILLMLNFYANLFSLWQRNENEPE